jgi:hypothetical protein
VGGSAGKWAEQLFAHLLQNPLSVFQRLLMNTMQNFSIIFIRV